MSEKDAVKKQKSDWPTMIVICVILLLIGVNNTIRVSSGEDSRGIIYVWVSEFFTEEANLDQQLAPE